MTGLLRQKMDFNGLIVTDALQMHGLMQLFPEGGPAASGRAAVEALKAGNDVLLIPADIDGAYNGVLNAVRSGDISESRINQSVLKVLRAKASVGLNKARLVDLNAVNQIIAKPENLQTAQRIADSSVTLVRDNKQVLPLQRTRRGTNLPPTTYQAPEAAPGRVLVLVISDDSRADSGRIFDQQMRRRIPEARVMYVDVRSAAGITPAVLSAVEKADKVIVAVYEVPVAGKVVAEAPRSGNSVDVPSSSAGLLRQVLQSAASKTVVAAMGSPYIISQFPETQTYLCTFSNVKVSEVSAVKALFGEIPMAGRLPVSIPNIAPRGSGLITPAQHSSGGSE